MRNFTYLLIILTFFAPNLLISQNTATYDITFNSTWNASEHESVPNNAHWSPLVGAVHKTENTYFETGTMASTGVKDVAELGDSTEFQNEVNSNSSTKEWLSKSILGYNQSTLIEDVEFTEEFHYLTLISMIAPSPDCFLSVNSLDLRNSTNTAWKTTFTIDVFIFDAGTDSGVNYNSADMTISPIPISKITASPFNGNKIGTLTLTQKSLSILDVEAQKNTFKLVPNPVINGKLKLIKSNNFKINSIEVYSVLGQQIKTFKTNNLQVLELNVSDLKSGVYLLKVTSTNNTSITKKLIIK